MGHSHLTESYLAFSVNSPIRFTIISPIDDLAVINEHDNMRTILYQPDFMDLFRFGRYSFLTLLNQNKLVILRRLAYPLMFA